MFRTTRSFLTLFLLLFSSLAVGLQAQTAPVVSVCQLSDFTAGPDGHAVYLFSFPGAVSPRYRWDTNGGTFTIYADSSARVTGTVINDSFPNWQWEVDYWFINQKDFTSWDALGRDVKIEQAPPALVNANKQDWLFWEFDSTRSLMVGVSGTQFDGDTLFISHNPPNREFGLQYGIAANSKDGDFGMSGWFKHSGAYTGHGDINVDASCGPAPCDVDITSASPSCLTDSTFTATVTFTGTGGPFILNDNKGSAPLVVNTAGTYQYGSYSNGDSAIIYISDSLAVGCSDTTSAISTDCTPAPVCDVSISSAVSACVTDSTFDVTVTIAGTGSYILTDDQGITNLSGLTAGTYVVGPYVSNTVVELYATDAVIAACADTVSNVTADCTPAPVCDVSISSAVPACATDSTFDVTVTIAGTGSYILTDDQGITNLSGLTAGTYVVGPYVSNTVVELYATDAVIAACADTVSNVTADCTPAPVCSVAIDSATATCATDSTFEIQISFSGAGPFTLFDDKGTTPLSGLAGGTYAFGSYLSNEVVTIYLEDPSIAGCIDSVTALTQTCIPVVPVCEVGIDTVYASCATDTSFTIFVQISGSGNTYQISDDQGTTPISGLSSGMYNFGNYFNSTNVLLTVTDLSLPGCDTTVGPVTADCTPVAVCDLVLDSVYTTCLNDSTFEVTINLLGSGQFYQVFDNQGSMPLFPVGAGSYTFGPYADGTQVTITASDLAIFNCFAVAGPISDSCGSGESAAEVNLWALGEDEEIQVGWEVTNVNLSSGFFLEKTMDPELETSWETVMWFPASSANSGNSSVFEFTDKDVLPSITYSYRVRAISNSGDEIYSNIASAIIARTSGLWIGDFFPNPTTGAQISFGMSTPETGGIRWVLYDMTGSKRGEGLIKSQKGEKIYLIEFDNLTTGVYSIQVWYEGRFIRSKKIIVTN